MKKEEADNIARFLKVMDKKFIENSDKLNDQQKEFLKQFIDACYEEFKKENNIK